MQAGSGNTLELGSWGMCGFSSGKTRGIGRLEK